MADERDEIRDRIDIVDLVGQKVSLKKAGKNWTGLCPFHPDKNPSFNVSPSMQRYTCWSCGEKGDVFTWVMKTQNVEFAEAIQILAKMAGVQLKERRPGDRSAKLTQEAAMEEALLFFRQALDKSPDAKGYCDGRGIDAEVRAAWEIGYAPDIGDALATHLKKKGYVLSECKNLFLIEEDPSGGYYDKFRGRIMIPTRDERGALVAFGGRVLGDGLPKYINSSDTPLYRKGRVLYGLHRAKDAIAKAKQAVLVEGYLDVIACHRAGVHTAIASLGTSLAEDQAKLLKRWCDGVVVFYDSDTAGQKAAGRASEVLANEGLSVRVALMPPGADPDTLLTSGGPAALQKAIEAGITALDFRVRSIQAKLDPEDQAYWEEMAQALATATNPIELDQFIVKLAAMYPGTRDRIQAQRTLRAWVSRARKAAASNQAQAAHNGTPAQAFSKKDSPMLAAEATVFRAFLGQPLRAAAWQALTTPELLVNSAAIDLAAAILQAFPTAPPEGEPSKWLSAIEPETLRELLADLDDNEMLIVTEETVADSVSDLLKRKAQRDLQQLKSGDLNQQDLEEIAKRLRDMKGQP